MTTTEQTLPPLPLPCYPVGTGSTLVAFSLGQMRAYASEAVRNALADMKTRKDAAYLERNRVVAALASQFSSGIARTAIEGWSEDWHGCVYIDLPTGQASWHYHDSHAHLFAHLPPYKGTWDGHTTEEKYERLSALSSICGESGKPKDARGCWNVRCQFSGSCVRNALATQAPTPEPDSRWMWKHVKSGGEYMRMANAKLQTDTPLQDMAELVIYRGADGLWWARPVSEFEGRFKRSQPIPRAATQAPAPETKD